MQHFAITSDFCIFQDILSKIFDLIQSDIELYTYYTSALEWWFPFLPFQNKFATFFFFTFFYLGFTAVISLILSQANKQGGPKVDLCGEPPEYSQAECGSLAYQTRFSANFTSADKSYLT